MVDMAEWLSYGFMHKEIAMRILVPFVLAIATLAAIACAGQQPTPTPTPTATPAPTATPIPMPTSTPVPTATPEPTPDVRATVEAGIAATREAEESIEATIAARVEATKAAEPTPTPAPTDNSRKEKLVSTFFECLESNLAVAGAFTGDYDGPLSGQVQTILDAAGDVTNYLHDFGAFEDALFLAMDANLLVAPAVSAISLGCSLIGGDPSETPEPDITPTLEPTPESEPNGSKCEELALKIIELSQDRDPSEGNILEITAIEEISDNLLGAECRGLSQARSGETKWIKFHQNRLGKYGYETLEPGDHECEYLAAEIIELSQDSSQEILEIRDIEEIKRDNDELICRGTAVTSEREEDIDFYFKATGGGHLSLGFELPASE